MYYVGIDWADEAHQVYITDDSDQKLDNILFSIPALSEKCPVANRHIMIPPSGYLPNSLDKVDQFPR